MKYIEEREAYERYDEMLDECNDLLKIGSLTYTPSQVLKSVDEIAYRCGFNDWCDSENITTDQAVADEEEQEESNEE